MEAAIETAKPNISKAALWTGRVISTFIILLMLFDGTTKIGRVAAVVDGTVKAGYPANLIVIIGFLALIPTILYAIPQTSVLGAMLLTAYFGGATATVVRLEQAIWWLPVACGVLTWLGLYLREPRLRDLVPFRR